MMQAKAGGMEFDQFKQHRFYDQEPMSLEDAARRASELGKRSSVYFYRVVPADDELTGFLVEAVPRGQVYVSFVTSAAERYARFLSYMFRFAARHRAK